MSSTEITRKDDARRAVSDNRTEDQPPLMGRKSVLMGMLASGFVIANTAQASSASAVGTLKPASLVATQPTYIEKWSPSTAYTVGQQVISPNNDVVSASTAHTSSTSYTTSSSNWKLSDSTVGLPTTAEQTLFISPRGSDTRDGMSIRSAKLTIAAALSALGGSPGVIRLGAGTFVTAATHTLPSGTQIVGSGKGLTKIVYTGTGTLFQGISGTRTYNQAIQNLTLAGPGKATTSVAVDWVDVSTALMSDFVIITFGTAVKHRSIVLGGAVYNDFGEGFVTSCGLGVDFSALGSNGSRWHGIKFGSCVIAVNILDSNQNNFHACQFESNATGIKIAASVGGGSDHNSFTYCRFEGNVLDWTIVGPTVRDTQIIQPAQFGAYTYTDNGARTSHVTSGAYQSKVKSTVASATGAWMWERTAGGGAETPAVVMRDAISTSGRPVTVQIETESSGYFLRGKRGGVNFFDVSSLDGSLRLPAGGSVELSARTSDYAAPTTAGVRIYSKKVGTKTALFARFPTGAVVQIAIEP